MNKFIEGLRTSLESALLDMGLFMQGVFSAVTTNAPAILEQYNSLGLSLDSAIINPWIEAANKIKEFGGVNGLGIMNDWITEGGAIYDFDTKATDQLKSPWDAGKIAVGSFKDAVGTAMSGVYTSVESNVEKSAKKLNELKTQIDTINDTTARPPAVTNNNNNNNNNSNNNNNNNKVTAPSVEDVKALQRILNNAFFADIAVDGKLGKQTTNAIKKAQETINKYYGKTVLSTDGKYGSSTRTTMLKYFDDKIKDMKKNSGSSMIGTGVRWYTEYKQQLPAAFHAKGTLGTTRDELAITDESWIGEEITLAAGKNGQLQYLKKGSAVMPADISANLVEWGKLNPDMMKVGTTPNISMINNCVSKPELNFSFDALVKAERITEDTLPQVQKLVTQELDKFTKQLNYALKGRGAR